MVCGDIGVKDDSFEQPAMMNRINLSSTTKATTSYLAKCDDVSIGRRRPTTSFSYAILFFAFACACLPTPLSAESNDPEKLVVGSANSEQRKCPNCNKVDHEFLKNVTLEEIKSQILARLGFNKDRQPNAASINPSDIPPVDLLTNFHHRPNHIRHEKFGGPSMMNDEAARFDDDDGLKTHTVVAKAKEGESVVNVTNGAPKKALTFTFESLSKITVTNARLLLYQKVSPRNHFIYSRQVKLSVYKVNQKGSSSQHIITFPYNVTDENGKWINFEFGKDIALKHFNEISDSSQLNFNLVVFAKFVLTNVSEEPPFVIDAKKCDKIGSFKPDCANVPYLQLEVEEPRKRRSKRSANTDCPQNGDSNCCRYPLTVDFEKFGWDWVIAPKTYQAYYCAGDCPYHHLIKFGHSQMVKIQAEKDTVLQDKVTLCCAPRSLSSIAMLYFTKQNNIVYGVLPGMVVDRCGCS